jgi:hypothetical protein
MTAPYLIRVTGSAGWSDEQELRLDLIRAAVPHLPAVAVVFDGAPAGIAATVAEWVRNYGIRAMSAAGARPDVVLAFGDSPAADDAERAGVRVRRYALSRSA